MPKVVDHDQRREQILAALWRVVDRYGVDAVTVRSVATEAGLSKTNIGHYFDSRAQLLGMAVEQLTANVLAQVEALDLASCDLDTIVSAAMLAIPGTSVRRRQSQLWLQLMCHSAGEPELLPVLGQLNRAVREGVRRVLQAADDRGVLGAGRDVDSEAARLHALIDGLSLQTLTDEAFMPRGAVGAIVSAHVRDLGSPQV